MCRYICENENQISLAVSACQAALDDAGLTADQIDTLIFGAAVPYQLIPVTAPLVMRGLKMGDGAAAAFDVNSTCLSFVSAFDAAARQIATGVTQHPLIVSAEIASRALPWGSYPETAALFGDGAAAMILSRSPDASSFVRVAAVHLRSYPSAYEACEIGAGGTRIDFRKQPDTFAAHGILAMDGKMLFRLAAQHFKGFLDDLLS